METKDMSYIPKTMLVKQFADYSGLTVYAVRKGIKSGLIAAIMLDGRYRILVEDTMTNLKAQLIAPSEG